MLLAQWNRPRTTLRVLNFELCVVYSLSAHRSSNNTTATTARRFTQPKVLSLASLGPDIGPTARTQQARAGETIARTDRQAFLKPFGATRVANATCGCNAAALKSATALLRLVESSRLGNNNHNQLDLPRQ